jgi:hypothetical protein
MCRSRGRSVLGRTSRSVTPAVAFALLLAACSATSGAPAVPPVLPPPTQAPEAPAPPPCLPLTTVRLPPELAAPADGTPLNVLDASTSVARSLALLATAGTCARTVVVVTERPFGVLAIAAQLAAAEGLPLLVLPDAPALDVDGPEGFASVRTALTELGVREVLAFGPVDDRLVPDAARAIDLLQDGTRPAAAAGADPGTAEDAATVAAADALAARWGLDGPTAATPDPEQLATRVATGQQDRVLLPLGPLEPQGPSPDVGPDLEDVADRTAGTAGGLLWLGDVNDPVALLATAATAAARGEGFRPVDGTDPRRGDDRVAAVRGIDPERALLVGTVTDDTAWQLRTLLDGTTLVSGGLLPLDGRRIVALYGAPGFPSLGVLGQQDLEATIDRARETAAPYTTDERTAVPAFDLIATIASASAGPLGDYSQRLPITTIRPYVDRAREEGFVVLLDLQPGRTSFLEQAQEYEELLREPHVGLALDPEWRLGPTEVHLRRIGSVPAAEVQQVVDWLAGLVREELLPQKVLVLHQFTLDMLPDRDTIVIPPELLGVVHVDGQGSLPAKYRTFAAMSRDAEDRWVWGWKNFLRIDRPVATPEQVLALDPEALVITYQ